MAKEKRKEISFYEKILRMKKAGLGNNPNLSILTGNHELLPLSERLPYVDKILKKYKNKKIDDMYAFVLYDIEDNRVRNHIAKYLIKKGCVRVQKSVFLAELKRKLYDEIHTTLKEINTMYDNHDSIFFIPVGEDVLNKMKIVGKNIDFELAVNPGNTLFI